VPDWPVSGGNTGREVPARADKALGVSGVDARGLDCTAFSG